MTSQGHSFGWIALAAIVAIALPSTAGAEAVTLKGASCFPKGTYFSQRFERFVEDTNRDGEGVVQIDYVGGAPAIGSQYELVQKMSAGVYDIVSCTGSYYQNVLPEADALKMWEKTPQEIRRNGGYAFLNELHHEKNLHYLARTVAFTPFHLYLNKKIDGPDLSGLKLRVAPIYTAFFQAMGANTVQSGIGEVFTYMENGTVDGYGWPVTGLLPDWYKVTKYRVDPGFYDTDIQILVNYGTWQDLSPDQQAFLQDMGLKYEGLAAKELVAAEEAMALQTEKGIEPIVFEGADRDEWHNSAIEAGWARIIERSPKHGPKLREYFAR